MVPRLRVESRRFRAFRAINAALAAVALLAMLLTPLPTFAAGGQTGNLQGTVVDAATGAAIPNAKIDAVSPSGSYHSTTNAQGFFSILGLNVDSYTVSVEVPGYDAATLPGTTIPGDQILNVGRISLTKTLKTIGRVTARSQSSAYQPGQTTDSYTVSGNRILQSVGKTDTTNENNIILSVPGVSLTNSGMPTVRGGAPTEVGFQLDGISFNEPFLYGNGSFNRVNGLGSIQVVEGAGDATQGDVGSGVINVIPKRGTYPASGTADFEMGGPAFSHQFAIDYGFSTPSGNISNYFAYTGDRFAPYYGPTTQNVVDYGLGFGTQYQIENQLLDNFVFKFGHNNAQSLQVLYSNQDIQQFGNVGGLVTNPSIPGYLSSYPINPLDGNEIFNGGIIGAFYGSQGSAFYQRLIPLDPYTTVNPAVPITSPEESNAANTRFLKFEYDNAIDSNTFLALRYFNWSQLQSQSNNYSVSANSLTSYQTIGGNRDGGILDLSRQIGSKLTISLNGEYQVLHPIWNLFEPQLTFLGLTPIENGAYGSGAADYSDFLPGGYLAKYFGANVPRLPNWGIDYHGAFFQEYGAGVRFQYAPTSRLKFDLGVRNEQQYQHWIGGGYSPDPSNPFAVLPQNFTDTTLDPHVLQPRTAVSYQAGPNDSFRFGYGRSAVFVNSQTAGTPFNADGLAPFQNIPAKPGAICGNPSQTVTFACSSYAAQLFWQGDSTEAPDAGGSNVAIYSNYDFTYQHRFSNGFGLHVTPFYKLGTDLPAASLLATLAGGQQIFGPSDKGFNRTTGVEFEVTTPEKAVGFSGFFSTTYQNVLQSAPPLSNGEDSEPQLSAATLALGNVYRAGYVSPLSTRVGGTYAFKNGLRITPVLQYDLGYPFNVGEYIASTVNGQFTNVRQVNYGVGLPVIVGYQNSGTTGQTTNYYDPAFPGNNLAPNIAASRGTPTSPSNGGVLWKNNLQANLTAEYHFGRSVIGASATNLFGNAYNGTIPLINPYYQPVATGLSGPLTGQNPLLASYGAYRGAANIPTNTYAYSNGAYLLTNGVNQQLAPLTPTTFTAYYQYRI